MHLDTQNFARSRTRALIHGTARSAFIAALAAAAPIAASAHAFGDDSDCDQSTLRGLYLFHASGFNIVSGAPVAKAIVEYIRFNGDGTLSVPSATLTVAGAPSPIRTVDGSGTYTLGSNCNGSIQFNPGPTLDIYVSGDRDLVLTQTGGAVQGILQGEAERVRR